MQDAMMRNISSRELVLMGTLIVDMYWSMSSNACRDGAISLLMNQARHPLYVTDQKLTLVYAPMMTVGCMRCSRNGLAAANISPATMDQHEKESIRKDVSLKYQASSTLKSRRRWSVTEE